MNGSSGQPRSISLPLMATCLAIILPMLVLTVAHFTLPSDGVLLDLSADPPGSGGLYVAAAGSLNSELRAGDLLLAVNGQPLEARLGLPPAAAPAESDGGHIRYLVERGGSTLEVTQTLQRYSPVEAVASNWPSFLSLLYLELVAVFVYLRRPDLPAARSMLLFSSLMFSSGPAFFLGLHPVDLVRGWPYWIFLWESVPIFGLSMAGAVHFLLLFPKKRAFVNRHGWAIPLVYIAVWLQYLPLVASGWTRAGSYSARLVLALRMTGLFNLTYPLLGMAVLIYGYLRSFDSKERRQTRWLLWAGAVVSFPWVGLSVIPDLLGYPALLPQFTIGLLWMVLPTAFAIAIVRESLFDIDRIINRTLVYASVTLVLVALYFGTVVSLQQLLVALTGQQSPLAIVASTLVIAALFNPLRNRIQRLIDRRFYRQRYNAGQALQDLSVEMQRQVDLADLSQSILDLSVNTLQPMHVSLWLRRGEPSGAGRS